MSIRKEFERYKEAALAARNEDAKRILNLSREIIDVRNEVKSRLDWGSPRFNDLEARMIQLDERLDARVRKNKITSMALAQLQELVEAIEKKLQPPKTEAQQASVDALKKWHGDAKKWEAEKAVDPAQAEGKSSDAGTATDEICGWGIAVHRDDGPVLLTTVFPTKQKAMEKARKQSWSFYPLSIVQIGEHACAGESRGLPAENGVVKGFVTYEESFQGWRTYNLAVGSGISCIDAVLTAFAKKRGIL